MNDDLDLDLDNIHEQAEQKEKVKNRFSQLSEKVIITSKERDEANAKLQAEAEARTNAEKERDFYKGFSTSISKYPHASEYQDKILEKVKSGYDVEDAMVAVLAKEGRLNMSSAPVQQPIGQVEGGSAPTITEGSKTLQDMSPEEKFAALVEAEKTGGLQKALRGQ